VLDGGSRELRFYTRTGELQARLGGHGGGPGEFGRPYLVPQVGSDSLLIHDAQHRRLTLFAKDPPGFRQVVTSSRLQARAPLGAAGFRLLLGRSVMDAAAMQRLGVQAVGLDFVWVDAASESEVLLRDHSVSEVATLSPPRGTGPPILVEIPFASRPSGSVSPQGVHLTSGEDYEIESFDLRGRLVRITRVEMQRSPVTDEAKESMLNVELLRAVHPSDQSVHRRRFNDLLLPDSMPAFAGLIVDEIGWLWARTYEWHPDRAVRWIAIDPTGLPRGSVEMPARLEVRWIGADHVLGIWRDELGVEQVRKYSLTRTVTGLEG